MPIRISQSTEEYLINAALPEVTATYTVISHKQIIDKTKEILDKKGFIIERELYKCSKDAQVAQGIYHLKYGNDPDMSMLFAWSNSYDKTAKFRCSIGAYVHSSLSTILSGNIAKFKRKHTGTADQEAFDMISSQLNNADAYFNNLIIDKEQMKVISITEEARAEFMGVLYLVKELINGEQLGTIKHEFNKPSFVYTGIQDSIWVMYNAIIYALQKAHPKTWMDQQSMVHYLICEKFNIVPGVLLVIEVGNTDTGTPANQIDLEEMIKEVETEQVTETLKEAEKFDAAKLIAEHAALNDLKTPEEITAEKETPKVKPAKVKQPIVSVLPKVEVPELFTIVPPENPKDGDLWNTYNFMSGRVEENIYNLETLSWKGTGKVIRDMSIAELEVSGSPKFDLGPPSLITTDDSGKIESITPITDLKFDLPKAEASPVVGQTEDGKPLVQPEKPNVHFVNGPNPAFDNVTGHDPSVASVEGLMHEAKSEDEGEGFAWICQGCGDLQGPTDIFYEGQLCGTCYNLKNGR